MLGGKDQKTDGTGIPKYNHREVSGTGKTNLNQTIGYAKNIVQIDESFIRS